MKALVVGAFNQEKTLVGAFSVFVQPVMEPMDRFTALDRNNNNNNMYESMNTNTNTGRRLGGAAGRGAAQDRAVEMMVEEEVSPWDPRLVAQLLEAEDSRGLGAVEAWLSSVLRAAPACAAVVPCLAAAEWTGARLSCPDTNLCPLFEK